VSPQSAPLPNSRDASRRALGPNVPIGARYLAPLDEAAEAAAARKVNQGRMDRSALEILIASLTSRGRGLDVGLGQGPVFVPAPVRRELSREDQPTHARLRGAEDPGRLLKGDRGARSTARPWPSSAKPLGGYSGRRAF
jgi:hypothetical protein